MDEKDITNALSMMSIAMDEKDITNALSMMSIANEVLPNKDETPTKVMEFITKKERNSCPQCLHFYLPLSVNGSKIDNDCKYKFHCKLGGHSPNGINYFQYKGI